MKRKQKGKLIIGFLAAIVVLGIGYAIVTSLNMSIGGNASVKPNGELKVRFVKNDASETAIENPETNAITMNGELADGTAMNASNLSAEVTSDTEATFAINELVTVGDYAEFTYTVVNESDGIDAQLSFDVSNANNEADYFNITKSVDNTVIGEDEIAKFKVKVLLTKSPKIDDVEGTFTVTLTATPKDEGTVANDPNGLSVSEEIVRASTQSEVTKALKDPDVSEIILADDVDYGIYAVKLPKEQDVTIDLNGNELKTTLIVQGNLTIEDTSRDGSGDLKSAKSYALEVPEGGNVVMNSGEIVTPEYYGVYLTGGSMAVNGGTITSKYSAISSNNTTGIMDLTINGGTFTAENGNAIYMPTPKSLTINDGTFNGGLMIRMGDVTINGGTINSTTNIAANNYENYWRSGNTWYGDAITVLGGTYTANGGSNDLNLKITGGTINSISGVGAALAVLNLGNVAQEMNIDITGGTFKTNATNRNTFEIKSADDINAKAEFKKVTNHVNVNITGGTGLTGITTSGTY